MKDYYDPNNLLGYDPYKGMSDEKRMRSGCAHVVAYAVGVGIGLLLCALLGSCKTRERIVTIETVRVDTTYITRHERDSIHEHDSTHVSEKQRGDTIFVEVDRWRTKFVERLKHDTLFIARHDTVPRPYPVIQEVPAQLTWWQQTLLRIGIAALVALLGWIVGKAIRIYIRK